MPRFASDISELPALFLRCRDEGHSWFDPSRKITKNKRVGNHIERRSTCVSCGTKKMQVFTPGGKVVTFPRYDYPDGYLVKRPKGAKRVTRAEVRRLTLRAVSTARRSA